MRRAKKRRPRGGPAPGSRRDCSGEQLSLTGLPQNSQAITAVLTGRRCVAVGLGFAGTGPAPCLSLCRQLLAHGISPETPLTVYRGETVALRITSVGQGAQLTVKDAANGQPRFAKFQPFAMWRVEAPVAKSPPTLPGEPPAQNNASGEPPRVFSEVAE